MYTLGLDLSTQSLSAVLLEREGQREGQGIKPRMAKTWSIPFRDFVSRYGLDANSLCLPSTVSGFFAQEPQMFLHCLDLLLEKMQQDSAPLGEVGAVNCSAQQHGQLWLAADFDAACARIKSGSTNGSSLAEICEGTYAYPAAPIWMCSQTAAESQLLKDRLGEERVLALSGSAAPLRFSGLVLRWLALHDAAAYQNCAQVHLLSSWLAAVLSGEAKAPIDWGNGAGTSMMDYRAKTWSDELLGCLGEGLDGGAESLCAKLPPLASPLSVVGNVAAYFSKYGLSPDCKVLAGSGDNPQTKVCQQGDLLSLGSSFVLMSRATELHPWANAMYDGLGEPFSFACRTNGALVWDSYRKKLGLDLAAQGRALAKYALGDLEAKPYRLMNESFPPQEANAEDFEASQVPHAEAEKNLVSVIDGTLLELHRASAEVFAESNEVLYVTGGPSQSPEICQRIAAIWQRPVELFESSGAAYGAALAAMQVL